MAKEMFHHPGDLSGRFLDMIFRYRRAQLFRELGPTVPQTGGALNRNPARRPDGRRAVTLQLMKGIVAAPLKS
jgi:hypothetical protein